MFGSCTAKLVVGGSKFETSVINYNNYIRSILIKDHNCCSFEVSNILELSRIHHQVLA